MRERMKAGLFRYALAHPSRAVAGAYAAGGWGIAVDAELPARERFEGIVRWANGLGKKVKAGALSWAFGVAETIFTKPTTQCYLALLTVEWKYSLTGTEFTEPGTGSTEYEGYARKKLTLHEAVEGEEAEIYNTAKEEFAAITGSGAGAKIIGWGISTALTAGTNVAGGTCTETTISKANSPAYVEAAALKIKLK